MSKPTIRIHNIATDEVIDREMTNAEYADYQEQQAKDAAMAQEQLEAEAAKALAQSKLEALGLTVDDLKALGL